MIHRVPRAHMFVRIAVLVCAFAPLSFIVRELNAQAAYRPPGLPDWAFNVPDKIQPTAVRPAGIVRAPPAARKSTMPPRSPGMRLRRTGSPTNTPRRRDQSEAIRGSPWRAARAI